MSAEKRPLQSADGGIDFLAATSMGKGKKQKKAKKSKKNTAHLADIYGERGQAAVDLKVNSIRLHDVQDLILWLLGDGASPRWAFVQNKPLIRSVLLVLAHGVDADMVQRYGDSMPFLSDQMKRHSVECLAPSASISPGVLLQNLLTVPKRHAGKQEKQKGKSNQTAESSGASALRHGGPHTPSHYRLTLAELEEHEFPLPTLCEEGAMRCPEHYVATQTTAGRPDAEVTSDVLPLVALDCEMCQTGEGLELTRVTLTDEDGEVLLDELVKPRNHIVDYLTRFSGITADMLEAVETRLEDARAKVMQHVRSETLLVGHSLQNDLHALKLVHVNILDTSILFPHHKGPPHRPALRVLAERYLRRSIQRGSHDSKEDARAAMDLVKLKLKHGPSFGLNTGERRGESLFTLLSNVGKRMLMVDRPVPLHQWVTGNCGAIAAYTDEGALQGAVKAACKDMAHHLIVTQLMNVHQVQLDRMNAERGSDQPFGPQETSNSPPRSDGFEAVHGGENTSQPAEQPPPAAGAEVSHEGSQCSAGTCRCGDSNRAAAAGVTSPQSQEASGTAAAGEGKAVACTAAVAGHDVTKTISTGATGTAGHGVINTVAGGGEDQLAGVLTGHQDGNAHQQCQHQRQQLDTGGMILQDSGTRKLDAAQVAMYEQRLQGELRDTDARLQEAWQQLPPNTLLLLCTGAGDTATVYHLQRRRNESSRSAAVSWTLRDEEELARLTNVALQGLCVVAVKPFDAQGVPDM